MQKTAFPHLLTENQILFYRKNGFCVLENVLNERERAHYMKEADGMDRVQEKRHAPLMNPDRSNPGFRSLLCHRTVIGTLEMLLGGRVSALQSMIYFKPPGSLGRDLHQDNFYAEAPYDSYIGTWLALELADRENGGLLAYPGSQKEPLLPIVEDKERLGTIRDGFVNDRGRPCVLPPEYEKVYLTVPAGSMVFIHGQLIHGSEENLSRDRFRRAFVGHYIRKGAPFRPGQHAKRTEIDVYGSAF